MTLREKMTGLVKMITGMLLAIVVTACDTTTPDSAITQEQLNQFAETLKVKYTVLNNRVKDVCGSSDRCFSVRIDLTAQTSLPSPDWQLYYSQLFPLHRVDGDEFSVETINGDLTRIVPTEGYRGFNKGDHKSLTLYLAGTHGNEFEAMPNYYIVADGLEPRIITSTVPITDAVTGLEIMPHLTSFTDAELQFRITDKEKIKWATSSILYAANENNTEGPVDSRSSIIPTPFSMEVSDKKSMTDLAPGIRLYLSGLERHDIVAALDRLAGFGVSENKLGLPLHISIISDDNSVPGSYSLDISSDAISIISADKAGAFYGLQSLAGLVSIDDSLITKVKIKDHPRYQYRGLHIDVARNFHSKQQIIKMLDQMGAYKLNKLLIQLGDDEGWRLQIPGLPELTEIGSKRCHDLTETKCLLPQLGSGPYGNTNIDGYFTVEDYQDILRAASARYIQVIPFFDMPSHARAAVKSMEARYNRYMAEENPAEAMRYMLTDTEDTSRYKSIQNYTDNTINVCLESAFVFFEKVVSEIHIMHEAAGHPLGRYHFGADETADAWTQSPACQKFFADNADGITKPKMLGTYFVERVAGILSEKNILPAGWSDGLGHTNPENMPKTLQSNAWGRLVDPAHLAAHKQVNIGWQVINSIPDVSYFDFPYEADPKERGYYWASRATNSRKVFEFMPDNLPVHAEFWKDSEGLDLDLRDGVQKDAKGNIIHRPMDRGKGFSGIQADLWSETVRSDEQVDYMLFPRLLALAERAWYMAPWEVPYNHDGVDYSPQTGHFSTESRQQRDRDWNSFAATIADKELAKLDLQNIFYRIPTVGAKKVEGILYCNIIFPGLTIEYRQNGKEWRIYSGPVEAGNQLIEVRATSADGKRKGRVLKVN